MVTFWYCVSILDDENLAVLSCILTFEVFFFLSFCFVLFFNTRLGDVC